MNNQASNSAPCRLRASTTAVRLAFPAACLPALLLLSPSLARAEDDPALTALVKPRSSIEIGVRGASSASAKADEYSGWVGTGRGFHGSLDLQGGGAYDSDDLTRWRVQGSALGSRSSQLQAEYGVQGGWRIKLGSDELRHQISDSFQTPYLGVGSSTLTLPPNWVVPVVPRISTTTPNARGLSTEVTASNAIVGGVSVAPTAAQAAQAAAMQGADLPAFQRVDLYTQRSRQSLSWEQDIVAGWAWTAGVSREHTQGLRALPGQSRAVGGDTSSILPAPLDQDDEGVRLGLTYTGAGLQAQLRWEESAFRNHIQSVSWNLWASPQVRAADAVAPGNRFRKLLFDGSWQPWNSTTLQAHASRSRATQNDSLLQDSTAPLVPVTSAQALVVSDSAGFKLLHKAGPRLNISGGYKFDHRDNRTPVNTYGFYDNNSPATGVSPFAYLYPQLSGLGTNFNLNANTPYSRRVRQLDLDATYRLDGGRQLRAAWETQKTRSWCNGSWINCADAPESTEHTLKLQAHGTLVEDLQGRVAISAAQRKVTYDENAFLAVVPMAGKTPSTATGALAGSTAYGTLQALGLTGYGPVSGLNPAAAAGSALGFYFPLNNVLSNTLYGNQNRISELIGMRRYDQADRDRGVLNASLSWQPGERWSLQAAAEGSADHYARSVYGLQRGSRAALHVDAGYAVGERWVVNGFASQEDQRSRTASNTYTANSATANVNGATVVAGGCYATIALRNANNKIDPCLDWTAASRDQTTTLGVGGSAKKLFGGLLEVSGNASFSDGRHAIDVRGGSYVNNPFAGIAGAASSTLAASYVPATPLPDVRFRAIDLQFAAAWHVAAGQTLRLGYSYRQQKSSDWRDEGLADGGLTQVLPTREVSPRYRQHVLALGFSADF